MAREAAFDQKCGILLKPELFHLCATIMPAPIDVDFLNHVCVATIGDFVAFDIKRRLGKYDKLKVEGDFLYFEEHLFIPEGLTRLRILQF